ncbi:tetratricopeptide repeat protein [Paenibacillus aurantius]|uniref:Tetratricopeptide repeat protein n=1 Tax=Paenibacillus aurantius TaxID=2918900 RepID=A0AA96RF94_9BACL|nr:tetratricopeptide repeat protein [Paenibacillus aurantius]WNQ11023.1 tetratricopeptide repeat protein [Paenibacillus aurantius]
MERKKKAVADPKKHKVVSIKMDATFFFERAVRSLDRFHYDKALKYFRRAVEYEPDNPVNHCNLAGILSEMGSYGDSNEILQTILDEVDPTMTECYFYMANNYANMEDFESAEKAIIQYLEKDPAGQFLEESEEMIELLSYELDRPTPLTFIKSREGLFEHDKARKMLEEGRFVEAVRMLQRLIKKYPEFLAARNNLALAYYYLGQFDKAMDTIKQVIELEPGNLHALCNLAIFYHHFGAEEELGSLMEQLQKTYPFQTDNLFKLATTMGILGDHESAFRLFRRMIKTGEGGTDPCLYHYTAVAAYNTSRFLEARRYWQQTEKLDPKSDIPRFFLSQLDKAEAPPAPLSYHYHLPFEEQLKMLERTKDSLPDYVKRDPLVRSSFFWALRHGDPETKLQVLQAFGMIADPEVEEALRAFMLDPDEDEYLKKVAFFVLRSMGAREPMKFVSDGQISTLGSVPFSPHLPVWEPQWSEVLELALSNMQQRYDLVQLHDLETLWVEYLTRTQPKQPKITKTASWSAALEYLTAKMHRRAVSYGEMAKHYGVSAATVSKHAKLIDEACKLKEKMDAIFPKYASSLKPKDE